MQCSKCRRSGWHKTKTVREVVRESGAGLDERMRKIAREVFNEEMFAVPVDDYRPPPVAATLPAVKMNDAMAAFMSSSPAVEPEPDEMLVEPCPYTEYDPDTGETYACGLAVHAPRVKHTRGKAV